jgi:phosphoribosylglycinamide formyltransferase-1
MGFASPPVVDQCDMGIDMRTKKELPAAKFIKMPFEKIEKKIAEHVDVDAVVYLPIEETAQAFRGTKEDFYYFPFGGPHPIRGEQPVFPKLKKQLSDKPKIAIFISGKGTFMPDILESIAKREMNAEVINIICNKPDAPGLEKAKKYNIPTTVLPYTNKFKDKNLREAYDETLIEHLKKVKPDMILLSGWQMILSEAFLKTAQEMEIPVINHHPSLLTNDTSETIATSRGSIPVLRGGSVWKDAFEKKLLVSGITVHQVLPSDGFDVGPVILKGVVQIKKDDTFEVWRKKMDEIEHLLLPTAIKRVLHVMKAGIDVSHGHYPW